MIESCLEGPLPPPPYTHTPSLPSPHLSSLQVSVGHIVPGGAAEVDGHLLPGDEIIYVDGQCVIGASHHKVVQIMGASAGSGLVALGVRRRLQASAGNHTNIMSYCNLIHFVRLLHCFGMIPH